MGTSVGHRPGPGRSFGKAPAVPVSVAGRPSRGTSLAPAGSVPVQPTKAVDLAANAAFGISVSTAMLPIAFQSVHAEFLPSVAVSMTPEGGTYSMTVPASLLLEAEGLTAAVLSAAAETAITGAATASPLLAPAAGHQLDVTVGQYQVSNQGINKSAPNQTTAINTYTEITGWQERSGFTGSSVTSRGLILPPRVTVNIVSRCSRASTSAHASMTHRVLANGVVIVNGTTGADTTAADGSFTTTVDTLITMEAYSANSSFDRLVVVSGANTYITATLV